MARKGGKRNRTGESRYSPRRLRASDRQRKCLDLAAAGKKQKEIGQIVGLTRSGVARALRAGLAKVMAPEVERYRARELRFLMARRRRAVSRADAGWDADTEKILLQNSKAVRDLLGLDAPAKIEHSGEMNVVPDYSPIIDLLKDREFCALARRLVTQTRT